ncbi:hypothetical protein FQA39_LY12786 [Lamprigera yunnana]|nr:hypothetical protein FQA39_LY12786 [Lamprigera yunnana]
MGKTAFALNLAYNAAKVSEAVAIFSIEMPAEQLTQRLLSTTTGIDSNKLRTERMKVFIDDTPGINVQQIQSKLFKLKRDHDVKICIIDYLQLITSLHSNGADRQNEISVISRQLKKIARDTEIPIVCLSQLSRSVEKREDKRPIMSDLRDSGAIEQDADLITFLYRDDYYKHNDDMEEGKIPGSIVEDTEKEPNLVDDTFTALNKANNLSKFMQSTLNAFFYSDSMYQTKPDIIKTKTAFRGSPEDNKNDDIVVSVDGQSSLAFENVSQAEYYAMFNETHITSLKGLYELYQFGQSDSVSVGTAAAEDLAMIQNTMTGQSTYIQGVKDVVTFNNIEQGGATLERKPSAFYSENNYTEKEFGQGILGNFEADPFGVRVIGNVEGISTDTIGVKTFTEESEPKYDERLIKTPEANTIYTFLEKEEVKDGEEQKYKVLKASSENNYITVDTGPVTFEMIYTTDFSELSGNESSGTEYKVDITVSGLNAKFVPKIMELKNKPEQDALVSTGIAAVALLIYVVSTLSLKYYRKAHNIPLGKTNFKFNTRTITYIAMLTAVSTTVTVVISMVIPVTVFPPIRVAFEGIMIKITGMLFGPIIDIDDKIIDKAIESKKSETEVSNFYIDAYFKNLKDLNIKEPTKIIKISDEIETMITFIDELVKNGSAYVSNGNVYFEINKFKDQYGKISKRNIDELIAGERIELDSNKKDPLDFTL